MDVIVDPGLELVALCLATAYVLTVWRHGSIFANARAYWESKGGFLGELLECPLCLSVYVAGSLWIGSKVLGLIPWVGLWSASMLLVVPAGAAGGLVIYHILKQLRK